MSDPRLKYPSDYICPKCDSVASTGFCRACYEARERSWAVKRWLDRIRRASDGWLRSAPGLNDMKVVTSLMWEIRHAATAAEKLEAARLRETETRNHTFGATGSENA
jgi:hypothetical protein